MLTNSKLQSMQNAATASDVLSGKTFYAGNKILKTGTMPTRDGSSITLNANTTSTTFSTQGKYCTGNMSVITSTKGAENKTVSIGGSATFETSGKLCTGNMTYSVPGFALWNLRYLYLGTLHSTFDTTTTFNVEDGAGTYQVCFAACARTTNNGYGGVCTVKLQDTTVLNFGADVLMNTDYVGCNYSFTGPYTFNLSASGNVLTYKSYWNNQVLMYYKRIA